MEKYRFISGVCTILFIVYMLSTHCEGGSLSNHNIVQNSQPSLCSVEYWQDLEDYLSGEDLIEYRSLENARLVWAKRYIESGRSVYAMNAYNDYINTNVKPFLTRIGASNPSILEILLKTNEERERDIREEKEWQREQIKKARNKWVDDNPQEARRRGIYKF